MVVEFIASIALNLVRGLFSLLPEGEVTTLDFSAAVGVMQALDAGLPVTEALAGVAILLAVTAAVWMFGVVRQIWRFVPFIGGG